jgi:predicted secreted protein with PEFG-CTERM motif
VKLEGFQKMMLMPLIFVACFLGGLPAFGQEIELTNIHTSQSNIHVGDSIEINATVVNNSPNTIYFNGGCVSPLSVIFDKNVATGQAMGCFAIFNANLKPGQNTTVVGPGSANLYNATSSGITDANVTFSYNAENKSQNTISKSFTFDISESTSIPEFPSISIVIFAIATTVSIVLVSRKNHNLFKL